MDGYEVCRRLRADARLAEVPVIMVTALDDQASRLAGIAAGADDFITKPFNRAELRARLRTITRLNRYRRLMEQRSQFEWVVEHAHDGYVLVNAADEILLANARARLWLGLPAVAGLPAADKFLAVARRMFACQPVEPWCDWPAALADERQPARLLVRPETAQARAFFLEVAVHDSPTYGRLVRLSDVTERLAGQRDHRSFQTMVSHKLRTPLNGILGMLEVLTADLAGYSREELAEYIGLAHQSAERLNVAVEDILRFAGISNLAAGSGFALSGLDEVVQRVAADLKLPTVAVLVAAEARSSSFACAPENLEWVLFELLENAKKYHPRHAPAVEVSARLEGQGWVVLTISDDGATLSPAQLLRVGSPFFQGEKYFTGEAPGMGLGLASVFALVWKAGGSCRVHNRTAAPGVCVELQWPRAESGRKRP